MRRQSVLDHKYIFEYDIGKWTFGEIRVLKERDTTNLKSCKTVPKQYVGHSGSILHQLQRLFHLQHPHVATVTDVLEDSQYYYVISDFCQGGEVADWLERMEQGYWPQEQAVAMYIREALLAVSHAHAAGWFHGDLKPSSLSLTSKLPDAKIKVNGFGLAKILDPAGSVLRSHPSTFVAPEVVQDPSLATSHPGSDIWSIGAIAHNMLVGRPPADSAMGMTPKWLLRGRSDEEGWAERSDRARDFVMMCLRPAHERPTAARALCHPWLKGLMPMNGPGWRADGESAKEVKYKMLCYVLAVLLIPVEMPFRDFEQLRIAFIQSDTDRDGYVARRTVFPLLKSRCAIDEAVNAALAIADVGKNDVLDLCATAVADLIAREFFGAGPSAAPLVGPLDAAHLAKRMLERFFTAFGGPGGRALSVQAIRTKLRTHTARDVAMFANVKYDDLLDCLPEDRAIDPTVLAQHLSTAAGRGTPLGVEESETEEIEAEAGWGGNFGLDVFSIFQGCGSGAWKRKHSPHGVDIH